jgi:hypothetical protein
VPPLAIPALIPEALRHQQLVPDGARPRSPRALAPRKPHRRELVLPEPLLVAHQHQGSIGAPERRSSAYSLTNLAESGSPASMLTASSSLEGAATLSEAWIVGLYQYISVPSFPKGRSHVCTRCYDPKTAVGAPLAPPEPLFTGVRGRVFRSTYRCGPFR